MIRRTGRYALRELAADNPRLVGFQGVPTFVHDEGWVLRGEWTPAAGTPRTVRVDGALPGLVHDLPLAGTAVLDHPTGTHSLLLTGDPTAPVLLFTDAQSTWQTPAWRTVPASVTGDVVEIDFSRAVNLPAGFSAHATCPRPPRGNHLPFVVSAGERRVEVTAR